MYIFGYKQMFKNCELAYISIICVCQFMRQVSPPLQSNNAAVQYPPELI